MEQESLETTSAGRREPVSTMSDVLVVDLSSFVNVDLEVENNNNGVSAERHNLSARTQGLCHVLICSLLKYFNTAVV